MYRVFRTNRFDKELSKKLSKQEQKMMRLVESQIANNPKAGDQLTFEFFREKKLKGKRFYYLIYDDLKAILMVAISDKKNQQKVIDMIKISLNEYRTLIEKIIREHDESCLV